MRLPAIVLVLLMFDVATSVVAQRRSALDDEIAQMFYEGLGRQIGAALESAGAAARGRGPKSRWTRRVCCTAKCAVPACMNGISLARGHQDKTT